MTSEKPIVTAVPAGSGARVRRSTTKSSPSGVAERVLDVAAQIGALDDGCRNGGAVRRPGAVRRGADRDRVGTDRDLHRALAGAAPGELDLERPEAHQGALAALLDHLGVDEVRVADEVGDEQARRLLVELTRRADLGDAAHSTSR